jgi:hypothetical protein
LHSYPWQLYTRLLQLDLMVRLEQTFPVDELKAEFDKVIENYRPAEQFGQYHRGGWSGVALHAIDGNPLDDQDNFDAVCSKTAALKHAPLMEEIIDSFPCEKRRVRLLRLAPGRKIFWHSEPWHSIDSKMVRLHIPITSNDQVGFQISHQDLNWQPGELWYGDFSFPHRLQNSGDTERIHLVIDLETNDAIRKLFPKSLHQQRLRRIKARARCYKMVKAWDKVFATELRLQNSRSKLVDESK